MAKNETPKPAKVKELKDKAKEHVHKVEIYVRENPVKSAGMAAAAGAIIGWFVGRFTRKH